MVILVTGGARSGKSRYAEVRLRELAPQPAWVYFATAMIADEEMRLRIHQHRQRRDDGWRTIEAPHDLIGALQREGPGASGVLVDCVTMWLSNRILEGATDDELISAAEDLARAARDQVAPVILVTNEVGSGIVPEYELGRRFRDLAGRINQRLAASADEVVLVACGLPLRLR